MAGVLKRTAAPEAGGGGAFRTSTALVTRRTLVSQTQVSATLADAGAYTIVNQATGTITTLPAVGRTVRQGGVLYAHTKGWATVIPPVAWAGGLAATMVIGAAAGLLPALRAARMSPTQALWTL